MGGWVNNCSVQHMLNLRHREYSCVLPQAQSDPRSSLPGGSVCVWKFHLWDGSEVHRNSFLLRSPAAQQLLPAGPDLWYTTHAYNKNNKSNYLRNKFRDSYSTENRRHFFSIVFSSMLLTKKSNHFLSATEIYQKYTSYCSDTFSLSLSLSLNQSDLNLDKLTCILSKCTTDKVTAST